MSFSSALNWFSNHQHRRWISALLLVALATAIVGLCLKLILVTVKDNHAGVLWKRFDGGTVLTQTFDAGIHWVSPVNQFYVYELDDLQLDTLVHALTSEGRPVNISVSVSYQLRRNQLALLHRNIGPEYRQLSLEPTVASALRQLTGKYAIKDVHKLLGEFSKRTEASDLALAVSPYVQLNEVQIKSVELPHAAGEH